MTMRDSTWESNEPTLQPTSWQRLKAATLSVEVIRQVDQRAVNQYHMSSLVLMENAAMGCVRWLTDQHPAGGRTVVLCGRGNNGGDGLAIARHLRILGWPVNVIQLGPIEELSSDARANWEILTAKSQNDCRVVVDEEETSDQVATWIECADVIIDAMLGSGARGTPKAPLAHWIQMANRSGAQRVAIDIPTGLDATSGRPSPVTFQASATLTFVANKPGFHQPAARACLGQVHVLPIGIPVELIDEILKQETGSSS